MNAEFDVKSDSIGWISGGYVDIIYGGYDMVDMISGYDCLSFMFVKWAK